MRLDISLKSLSIYVFSLACIAATQSPRPAWSAWSEEPATQATAEVTNSNSNASLNANASASPKPAVAPTASPKNNSILKSLPLIGSEAKLNKDLKTHCNRHFPGVIQGEIRSACLSAAPEFERLRIDLAQVRCRLDHGEEPRLVMACLIGASIAEDLISNRETFKKKFQLCAEHYPVHTEIDAFLKESCLTGIHLPKLMKAESKLRFDACAQITPERSFIGPCSVGISLNSELNKVSSGSAIKNQNRLCEQYFDHRQFHAGYRACLTARGLAPDLPNKWDDALKSCSNIVADANNDTERAACLVGVNIYRHLDKQEDLNKRFLKCGDKQVSYEDRDFLACLTAASLLDFGSKRDAEGGCREVFKSGKSRGRGDCLNSLNLF